MDIQIINLDTEEQGEVSMPTSMCIACIFNCENIAVTMLAQCEFVKTDKCPRKQWEQNKESFKNENEHVCND